MVEYDEKTERATPRRRQKARDKGQVPRSRELTSMAALSGIILVFYVAGGFFMKSMSMLTGKLLSLQYGRDPFRVVQSATSEMFWILMPFLGISATFALVSGAAQGGLLFKPITLEIERLNPLGGLKKLFSHYGLVEFLKSLFKFVIGGFLFYYLVKKAVTILPFSLSLDMREMLDVSLGFIASSVIYCFGTFLVLAVADYFYERWRFEQSIRMSREELKEEFKETEGDPLIKSRVKSLQKEMARRRMMQEIPKATVVITNPTHIAVALKYKNNEMSAPKVIAKGAGFVAEKIREVAGRHRIPIVEDKPIARALYKVKIGQSIPEELYKAVARILAYIYKLRGVA